MSSLRRTGLILALATAALLAGCGGGGGGKKEAQTEAAATTTAEAVPSSSGRRPLDASKTYTVTMTTSEGTFAFVLDLKDSPNATASFEELVSEGFFSGLTFHRIVPGFVIQCGDPNGDGTGGPGYTTVDVPPSDAQYTKGVVAMAKGGSEPPGTAGSQFFIVTGADAKLPPDYALLGKVTSGLAVVEKIGKLGDASEQPTKSVTIDSATVSAK
jgi:peptidyl-prolyl cis-trans isomerase B (cyclophilin B)